MRFLEVWSSMPQLFIIIIMSSVIVPNFWWLLWVLLLFSWISFVGVVRAEFLRARNFEFVAAAEAIGRPSAKNHVSPYFAKCGSCHNYQRAVCAGRRHYSTDQPRLSGLWPAAGQPVTWRTRSPVQSQFAGPWLGITSFVTIGGLLVFLLFIGEGVRDALDTRRKG